MNDISSKDLIRKLVRRGWTVSFTHAGKLSFDAEMKCEIHDTEGLGYRSEGKGTNVEDALMRAIFQGIAPHQRQLDVDNPSDEFLESLSPDGG